MADTYSKDIKKSESIAYTSPGFAAPTKLERGQPQPGNGNLTYIQDLKREDLKMPRRICTYDEMCQTASVSQALEVTQILSLLATANGKYVGVKGSPESQEAADFLNYCTHNMKHGTWLQFCTDMVDYLKYGFSLFNIVLEKRQYGEYKGSIVLDKLSPRSQQSLHGWMFNKKGTELLGMVQKPPRTSATYKPSEFGGLLTSYSLGDLKSNKYAPILNKDLLRFTHKETNRNPQGNSPLASCYEDWAEMNIIQQYEVIGVSKDLGGLVVVRVRQELLDKIKEPEMHPADYSAYLQLEQQVANIHAGKQSYIILGDESQDGKYSYDIKLLGIEGQGKQYKTSEIIENKKKNIYNAFGAGYLLLGQDSHGSYNLSSTAKVTHSFYVERNNAEIKSVLDSDLAPKLLAANGVYLPFSKMPTFEMADPDQLSLDEASKFIQRVKSVGALSPQAAGQVLKDAGITEEGLDGLDFTDKDQSRAGESLGTSGTGSSQDGGAGSTTNNENAVTAKSFRLDYEDNEMFIAVDETTGEQIQIKKES
jgi:hypothetical protein